MQHIDATSASSKTHDILIVRMEQVQIHPTILIRTILNPIWFKEYSFQILTGQLSSTLSAICKNFLHPCKRLAMMVHTKYFIVQSDFGHNIELFFHNRHVHQEY